MKIILSNSNDAYFNIASEEYLFKTFDDDVFYLYVNSPSIIVGRKQNTLAEINYDYVTANNIPVVRRMSGGGAVFHDLGNLNFCFIVRNVLNSSNDFALYTQPILNVLQKLGVNAKLEGRNDLTIDGKKFSGNAKYFSNKTLLQHGTILFTSKLTDLSQALNADPTKFNDKAVKSVQSRVTNITEHLPKPITMADFIQSIINYIMANYPYSQPYHWSMFDATTINRLVESKYGTYEWNFGKSPEYNYTKSIRTAGGTLQVSMFVKKGVIEYLRFNGDFFSHKDIDDYEKVFTGCPHDKNSIKSILKKYPANEHFININDEDILNVIL